MSTFSIPTTAAQYKMSADPASAFDTFRHPLELRYASKSLCLSFAFNLSGRGDEKKKEREKKNTPTPSQASDRQKKAYNISTVPTCTLSSQ